MQYPDEQKIYKLCLLTDDQYVGCRRTAIYMRTKAVITKSHIHTIRSSHSSILCWRCKVKCRPTSSDLVFGYLRCGFATLHSVIHCNSWIFYGILFDINLKWYVCSKVVGAHKLLIILRRAHVLLLRLRLQKKIATTTEIKNEPFFCSAIDANLNAHRNIKMGHHFFPIFSLSLSGNRTIWVDWHIRDRF